MKIKSLDYIITAKHYAQREGAKTVLERILRLREQLHKQRNIRLTINTPDQVFGKPVIAEIDFGQWIARCECGGAEFVDPDEPIFFCFGCANRENGNRIRPVKFPIESDRKLIEALVLARPVDDLRGLDDLERANLAQPLIYAQVEDQNMALPLSRCWLPDESIADLQKQNEAVRAWQDNLHKTKAED